MTTTISSTPAEARDAPITASLPVAPHRFTVIMADPPWDVHQRGPLGADQHYPVMTLDEIKGMRDAVKAVAADNAHLWLWVTNATLRAGYDVMEEWGFTPRSILTWVKSRYTLGQYLRNATEHVLFGTRGKAPVQFRSQPTWVFAPLQEHSVKPDEIYSIIDRVSGRDSKKLELFARRQPPAPNWNVWGNEIRSDVSLAPWGYPVPTDFGPQGDADAASTDSDGEG